MLFVIVFVILFGWAIAKGINHASSASGLDVHPSNFKKPKIEWVARKKEEIRQDKKIINLVDYANSRKIVIEDTVFDIDLKNRMN